MNKSFKEAVERANIRPPCNERAWTLHSLRHLYGTYMLNDYPIAPEQGRFGLPLTDVQMLMGHKSIRSTEKYARRKPTHLLGELQTSDERMLGLTLEERSHLPVGVLESLPEQTS